MDQDIKAAQRQKIYLAVISICLIAIFYGLYGLLGVIDLYQNGQFARGVVTSMESGTAQGRGAPTMDHTVVSKDVSKSWVFKLRHSTRIPVDTELLVIYSAKNPAVAEIWKPEYNVDNQINGRPKFMRLILENDRALPILLLPLAGLVLIVCGAMMVLQRNQSKT